MLALRGTPWDAKGRLATPVPVIGGGTPTAATASATRGSDAASAGPGMGTDAGPAQAGVAPDTGGAAGSTDQPMA
eukprot:1424095-Amphidinium_carterae.1